MSGAGIRRTVVLAAAAALLAGCLADATPPTGGPSASAAPQPTPTVTAYRLDRSVWYGGFVLTFIRATSTLDPKGGPVAVDVLVGNPGDDDATLDGPVLLASGGTAVEPTRESALPLVASRSLVEATLVFEVDGDFDVATAAIRVGRPEEHQAILPLVAGTASTVTLAPWRSAVAVDGQAGSLFVELRGVELRADLPDWREELDRSLMALTLTYHATFRSDFSGGFAFTGANVALRLPDGTTIGPRRDGHSQSVAVLAARTRQTGLRSRFEVPAPGNGHYALVIKDGSKAVELPFDVP